MVESKERKLGLKSKARLLTIVVFVLFIDYVFINFIPYKIMTLLFILLILYCIALYIRYNHDISMAYDTKEHLKGMKVNINFPFVLLCSGLSFRAIWDFNLVDYVALAVLSFLMLLGMLVVYLLFTTEYKLTKSVIPVIVITSVMFISSTIVHFNNILDVSETRLYDSEILEMRKTNSRKGLDRYLIKVHYSDFETKEIRVSKSYYENHSTGDQVDIIIREGFFKIKYVDVRED